MPVTFLKSQKITSNFATYISYSFMNKFNLLILAIIVVACGNNPKEKDETFESQQRSSAISMRDSAMKMAYGSAEDFDYEKILKLLDNAIAADPENKSIFYSKMQIVTKSGTQDDMFNMLLRLDTMDFKDPYADIQLGVEYELRGEIEKADGKYHDAIDFYAAILDTMENTPFVSRNNNVLNLAVAERLVRENPNKLEDVLTEDEKQYLGDLIDQIRNKMREELLEKNRKKVK